MERGPPVSANANSNANSDWLGEPVDMQPSAAVTVHPGLLIHKGVRRPKVGQRRSGDRATNWASRQDEDEDEDERTAARRETRVPSFYPYLVIPDFRPGSRQPDNPPPPSLHLEHLRKGRGSSLLLSIGEAAVVV